MVFRGWKKSIEDFNKINNIKAVQMFFNHVMCTKKNFLKVNGIF